MLSRLAQGVILLFIVSAIVFVIIHKAPGGPELLNGPELDPGVAKQFRQQLGLDDPIPVQYGRWIRNVLGGHLGKSYLHNIPVTGLVIDRIPKTLILSGAAIALAAIVAIPLGVISAVNRNSSLDYVATFFAFLGISIPVFWLGIMLIVLFSVQLAWLPSAGMVSVGTPFSFVDSLRHMVMPVLVLSTVPLGYLTRYVRSSMVEVLVQDYIRTARSKGLPELRLLYRHALRNALVPVVTVLGVLVPQLLGGAVITETIFAWPGLGRLAVESAVTRDYPVIMSVTLLVSVLVIVSNLVTDLAYAILDPRIVLE